MKPKNKNSHGATRNGNTSDNITGIVNIPTHCTMESGENWDDELSDVGDQPSHSWQPNFDVHEAFVAKGDDGDQGCHGETKEEEVESEAKYVTETAKKTEFELVESHPRKLYVSNVNFRTSQKALWSFLEKFGAVEYCRLLRDNRERSKGRGFVTYKSTESCENALAATSTELDLHNRTLKIEKAVWKKYKINEQKGDAGASSNTEKTSAPLESKGAENGQSTHDDEENAEGLNALPDDCLLFVFQYLSAVERLRLKRVCRRWRDLLLRSLQSLDHLDFYSLTSRFSVVTDRIFSPLLKLCGRQLRSLDLSGPKCRGLTYRSYELIGAVCQQLRRLDLSGSLISNRSLQMLTKGTPNLTSIRLVNCHDLGEKGLWWLLHQCQRLEHVHVSDNQRVTATCFHRLAPTLRTLVMRNCTGVKPEALTKLSKNCPQLEHLHLSECHWLSDEAFGHVFQACKKLKVLHLEVIARSEPFIPTVTEGGLMPIASLIELEELALPGNHAAVVTDNLIQHVVKSCRHLRKVDLSLSGQGITDAALKTLAELPLLTDLTISYNPEVTDTGFQYLSKASRLCNLKARCTHITDTGVCHLLSVCDSLSSLDVSGCLAVSEVSVRHLVSMVTLRGSSTDMFHFYVGGTAVETVDATPSCVRVYLRNLHDFSLMPGSNHYRRDYLGSDSEEEDELWFGDDLDEHEEENDLQADLQDLDDPLYFERFNLS